MCNPLTAAMAAVQIAGSLQQGRDAQRSANAEADSLDYQGALERANAEAQARRIRREGEAARGQTLGAIAASGVKVGEGSALDAERQVMQDYEQDAYVALLDGNRAARSLSMSADNARLSGRAARRASYFNAGASLLSTGAQGLRADGYKWTGTGFKKGT